MLNTFSVLFGGILVVDTIEELYGLAYIYIYPHLSGCSLLFFGPRAIMMIRIAKDNGILGDVSDEPLRPTFKRITAKIQYLFGPLRVGAKECSQDTVKYCVVLCIYH